MKPEELIKQKIKERGMTMVAASKMSGVKYSRLQPALSGAGELRADEYISLCLLLNICTGMDKGGEAKCRRK